MIKIKFLLLIISLAQAVSLLSLDLTILDMSHQYDPEAPVKMNYRVTENAGKYTVHLFVRMDTSSTWKREFLIQTGYESEGHRNLYPEVYELESSDDIWRGSISFRSEGSENLLIVKISSDFNFYFDISLKNGTLAFPSFYPISGANPVTSGFLPTQDIGFTEEGKIQIFEYPNRFGPADAPMDDMKALAPSIFGDTAFFMSDSLILKDYRLHFFKNDTLADIGVPLFKTPPYYPSLRKMGELIPPMKYITTEAEYRTLIRASKPKRTFDEFWINTYGTKFRARNAIRKYFKSVEYANEYFTTIKEGWKTDRGMILIIYGTPIEMYRNSRGETWIFEDAEFEFLKVSTLFGPVYALRRDSKFERDWYKKVGDIRRGE